MQRYCFSYSGRHALVVHLYCSLSMGLFSLLGGYFFIILCYFDLRFFAGRVSWQIAILHDFFLIAPSSVTLARQKSKWPRNTMAAVSCVAQRRRYPCTPQSVPSQQNFAWEVQKYILPGIAWRLRMYAPWRVSIATTSPPELPAGSSGGLAST